MADIKLPDLGENVEEGEVVNIMVAVGDSVAVDQPLLELEFPPGGCFRGRVAG